MSMPKISQMVGKYPFPYHGEYWGKFGVVCIKRRPFNIYITVIPKVIYCTLNNGIDMGDDIIWAASWQLYAHNGWSKHKYLF